MVSRESLEGLLRCPLCRSPLRFEEGWARCAEHSFPVVLGIPRLLPPDLMAVRDGQGGADLRSRTYRSFGFEWGRFSEQLPIYRENFLWYLEPLPAVPLRDRLVLDAGCGMGRHTHGFLREGAQVLAVDASPAIEIAARNNPDGRAAFVQADLLHLPVESGCFDLVCCLGVLHHLEDAERGLRELVRAARPGAWVLIYLYHDPSELAPWRGTVLSLVTAARAVTTRMPLGLLGPLTWLLAVGLFLAYIGPAKLLSRLPVLREPLAGLPLGQYVRYPFRVLWNDQFDRFSAPLEKRYRRAQVEALLREAGLEDVRILGGYGWRTAGRRPVVP